MHRYGSPLVRQILQIWSTAANLVTASKASDKARKQVFRQRTALKTQELVRTDNGGGFQKEFDQYLVSV